MRHAPAAPSWLFCCRYLTYSNGAVKKNGVSAPRDWLDRGTSRMQLAHPFNWHTKMAHASEIRWGIVGTTLLKELDPKDLQRAELGDEGFGFYRVVEADVQYDRPPLPIDRVWHSAGNQKYILKLPKRIPPDQVLTLLQLCDDVRQRLADLPAAERAWDEHAPEAAFELDAAVDVLLGQVSELHSPGRCGIGLLTPDGIVIIRSKGRPIVTLLDLGFYWETGPERPEWLRLEGNALSRLWEVDADEQQHRGRESEENRLNGVSVNPTSDVVTLSRVLASALLGRISHEVRLTDETARPCWNVLRRAIAGEFNTIEMFREALQLAPLSGHFNERKSPDDPLVERDPRITWSLPALIAAGLIFLLVGVYALTRPLWLPRSVGDPTAQQGASDISSDEHVTDGQDLTSEQFSTLSPEDQVRHLVDGGAAELRITFLEEWRNRFRAVYSEAQDATAAFSVGPKVRELYQELSRVHKIPTDNPLSQEEEQWLDNCRLLARQIPYFSLDG